ncbi:uncharacterized protein BROUX77_003135 [Berkeleyomyces rouxiae]|uniref:uncharacterized protein n=1 Tax=Berkeleyomyces rouxiae TaxID=2035830 RepID=UPI003B7EE028
MSYTLRSFGNHALQKVAIWPAIGSVEPDCGVHQEFWIVFIHGGAWRDPTINHINFAQPTIDYLELSPGLYRDLIGERSLRVASLEYRLSVHPNHPQDSDTHPDEIRAARHPEHIQDVCAGLRLLQGMHGLRAGGYILVGHSCGATLAFQSLQKEPKDDRVPQPRMIVSLAGIHDVRGIVENHKDSQWASVYRDFVVGAFGQDESTWDQVSPVNFLDKNCVDFPLGVVLCTAKADSLVEDKQREGFQAKCLDLGIDVVELTVEGDHDEIWQIGKRQAAAIQVALEASSGANGLRSR